MIKRFPLLLLVHGLCVAQHPGTSSTNTECIERLQLPTYPPIAIQARITGTIMATIRLGQSGSMEALSLVKDVKPNPLLPGREIRAARVKQFETPGIGI
jgi:hypothetical protein